MHNSVREFVRRIATERNLTSADVLELGSLDVNGTVRDLFTGTYHGVDIVEGPGVDTVASAHDIDTEADVVLCLEMLEHDANPNATFATIARCLTADGTAIITTRSAGFPHHHPPDLWRFTFDDIAALAYTTGLNVERIEHDPQPEHPGVFAVLTRP